MRHKHIAERHSNKGIAPGQLPNRPPGVGPVVGLVLLLALCLGATGCTTIYRRTRTQLPPAAAAELNLRLAEASQAEEVAHEAGTKLLDNLQHRKPAAAIQTDFDRLEAAAFDLERRALAAFDTAKSCGNPEKSAGEIEKLSGRARSWLEYVQANRTADPTQQLQDLQAIIDAHSRPQQ